MRTLLAVPLLAVGLALAPPASADPADLVPYCSGDQTPMDANCRATPSQVIIHDGTGLTPNLPTGLDPGNEPAI